MNMGETEPHCIWKIKEAGRLFFGSTESRRNKIINKYTQKLGEL